MPSHANCRCSLLPVGQTDLDSTCADCRGTGEYRGLLAVEPCQTCNGSGKVGPMTGVVGSVKPVTMETVAAYPDTPDCCNLMPSAVNVLVESELIGRLVWDDEKQRYGFVEA